MKNARNKITLATLLVASLVQGSAFAAVPAAATTALTSIETDGLAMLDAGWPVLVAIVGGFVLMKLFKKVISKAS